MGSAARHVIPWPAEVGVAKKRQHVGSVQSKVRRSLGAWASTEIGVSQCPGQCQGQANAIQWFVWPDTVLTTAGSLKPLESVLAFLAT